MAVTDKSETELRVERFKFRIGKEVINFNRYGGGSNEEAALAMINLLVDMSIEYPEVGQLIDQLVTERRRHLR